MAVKWRNFSGKRTQSLLAS